MPDFDLDELTALSALAPLRPRLVPEPPDCVFTWCPECGTATELSVTGHPALCYRCTCRELGYNAHDLAVCISHGISMKRWSQMESELDLPSVSYATWRKRLKR